MLRLKSGVMLAFTLLLSCQSGQDRMGQLYIKSSLKDTVAKGQGEPQLLSSEVPRSQDLFLMAPAQHFQGEVTVIAGETYWTQIGDGKLKTQKDLPPRGMVFAVYATCPQWKPIKTNKLLGVMDLEKYLDRLSQGRALFFQFQGKAKKAQAHVVHGLNQDSKRPDKAAFDLSDQKLHGLGVFSKNHRRIFTHHDRDTHIHVVDEKGHTYHLDHWEDLDTMHLKVCALNKIKEPSIPF